MDSEEVPDMYPNIRRGSLCDFQERLIVGRKPESTADIIPEGEIVLTINVYYPITSERVSFLGISKSDHLFHFFCWMLISMSHDIVLVLPQISTSRPHMSLLMTGSHSLAELRDAICCVSDLQVCGEFSNTPDLAPDFISKVNKRTVHLKS